MRSARPYNIAATGNLAVGGEGVRLWSITVNTGAASAVFKIYDGTSAVAANIKGTIDASAKGSYNFGGSLFLNGLFCVLSGGNADITVNAG